MNVLVINCSSSLKYQLLDMTTEEVLAKGLVERIGIEGICFGSRSSRSRQGKIGTTNEDT